MKANVYGTQFDMKEVFIPNFPEKIFCVEDFKESGCGEKEDKKIIQKAVDACYESGGGTVIVSQGEWLSGPIHLKSNIHLKLEKNAVIRFSSNFSDYLPVVFTRWEGMECYNYSPLIYANDCENIAITGEGTLLGSGEAWWHWKQLQQAAADRLCYAESLGISVEDRIFGTEEDALRPSFIQPLNCKKVLIEGITVKDGPQWTIHPVYCTDIIVRKVNVISCGHNTDGLNPDSCKNVLIEDCYFETGDDCIAINSGMNEDGWRVNNPCENVVIRNCVMTGGHGALTIGSGLSGGVKNIYMHDCKISGTDQGIRLKSMRGRGGYVEDVWFENITINDVKEEAVQINMFYGLSTVIPKSNAPTDFNNINIKNVYGKGSKIAVQIKGLPEHKLAKINLENINLSGKVAFTCSDVGEVNLREINLQSEDNKGAEILNVNNFNVQDFSIK